MARFVFLLHLLLLFFLACSSARVSLPLPQTEDPLPTIDSDVTVSDSDSNPTILLPSQKPISESKPSHNLDTSDELYTQSVPLTVISFRPINRHFPWRPFPFPSRLGHPCHHRHDHRLRPLGPRFRPYGNDMILSDEDHSFHPVTGRDRHSEPRFEHGNDLETSEDMMKPGHPHPHPHPHYHPHRHHEHEHEHDHYFVDEDGDERRWSWEREKHHGFMSKIRHLFFH